MHSSFGWSLINSVEITENSVKFSTLKNLVLKFSVNYWNFQINFNCGVGHRPEIVCISKLPYRGKWTWTYLGRGKYVGGRECVGMGGWRVRCREVSGKFRQFSEKCPRMFWKFFGISGNFRKTDRIYWSLLKFTYAYSCSEITKILKSLKIQ